MSCLACVDRPETPVAVGSFEMEWEINGGYILYSIFENFLHLPTEGCKVVAGRVGYF